jgi:Uma2 family endonuclease
MNAPARIQSLSRSVRARLTINDYYQMNDMGLLDRFGRTELIDGEIIVLNSLYIPHARTHMRVLLALNQSVVTSGLPIEVLGELTAELGPVDGPLPDITILDTEVAARAMQGVPKAALRLVVEIADSSARRDLGKKRKLYASRDVPEYWVVVISKGTIERFADPVDGDYKRHDSFAFADAVDSVTLPGVGIPAGTLSA